MSNDNYINKLYEVYLDEFKRKKDYQALSEKIAKKFEGMQEKFTEEQLEEVEEFEDCITSLLELEEKEAFKAGFKIAINLILEAKDGSQIY